MDTTVTRPPVDVAPKRSRPGLALLLAVLSVPGSTLAWDLPAGGFWIGLPLGVAAIALGIRAWRRADGSAGSVAAVAAIVIAALAIGSMVVWTIVSVAT